jgi:hypothetical protein
VLCPGTHAAIITERSDEAPAARARHAVGVEPGGDRALRQPAGPLAEDPPHSEYLFRWSGQEQHVLCPGTHAAIITERSDEGPADVRAVWPLPGIGRPCASRASCWRAHRQGRARRRSTGCPRTWTRVNG